MSESYILELPGYETRLEVDRLRREHHELIGELTVYCGLPGSLAVNGRLSTADFNFSSARARQDRAKLLRERAKTNGKPDWLGVLEELCQKVFQAEREGDPAVNLRDLPEPEIGDDIHIDGLVLPRRHPSILFGDGGAAKSLTGLRIDGLLALRGIRTAFFDWELSGEDHRLRFRLLFGTDMPDVVYVRCDRPLTAEVDRLRRIVREHRIEYCAFDSVAFACDGPPEAAEVAGRYFRCVRQIGCGSLHIAHINRSENSDQKPFGSTFWHNGARATWFVQGVETDDRRTLRLGFFNRKANLGPIQPAVSYLVTFGKDRTEFRRADITDSPELAGRMSIRQRMLAVLKHGALTPEQIAAEIEEKVDSVGRTIRRNKNLFIVIEGGRVGLREQSA